MRVIRPGRRFLRRFAILAALLSTAVATTHLWLSAADQQHADFYETGKSINTFLTRYSKSLEEAHATDSTDPLSGFYSPRYTSPNRGGWQFQTDRIHANVELASLVQLGSRGFETPQLFEEIQTYLGAIRLVDKVQIKIDRIEETVPFQSARVRVKYVLDGVDSRDRKFQDRLFFHWHLSFDSGGWQIMRDTLVRGDRVTESGPGFTALANQQIGLDYRHARDSKLDIHGPEIQFGVMQHGIGGVTTYDYDQDGWPDVFFADGERSRLFRNLGPQMDQRVAFRDVTEESGLDGIDQATSGYFADFDNDGDEDLLVLRYLAPSLYYSNDGKNRFTDSTQVVGLSLDAPALSATLLDYDRDGFLDIYVGVYGNAFEAIPRLPFMARNGQPNRLFRNVEGQGFVDATVTSGTGDTGWCMAVASADYDGDGFPDLATANDFGRKVLLRNRGDGTFRDVAKQAGVLDFSGGMGVTFGDVNDDGRMDLYTSNINSNQRWFGEDQTVNQYVRNVFRTRWALLDFKEYLGLVDLLGPAWPALGRQVGEGNSLFSNQGDGTFLELSESRTRRAGWSWSVAFLDFDNDSRLDISAANGWISGEPGTDL